MRTLVLAVLIHLPLEWNTYLLFNTDIVNFVWKTDEKGREVVQKALFCYYLFFGVALIVGG